LAVSNLDRIRNLVRDINLEAGKTASLFRELERIVSSVNVSGRSITGDPAQYRRATDELHRYTAALRQLEQQQRAAGQLRWQRGLPGAPIAAQKEERALPTDPVLAAKLAEQQKIVEAQQTRFIQNFGLTTNAAANATKYLDKYGLSLSNLKRVMIDPITGTQEFAFESSKIPGVIQRATFAFDKYGNAIGSSATRFRGFTDMITRNIVKVLEWAIAVGVVYGALSQLTQVFDTLHEIDDVMSDISFTMGNVGQNAEQLNRFFESSTIVARETGTAVRDVISVYDDALRATSSLGNEEIRLRTSTQLLNDAMLFSRLSGLSARESMDLLVGALKQVGIASQAASGSQESIAQTFGRGEEVMGTWLVAVQGGVVSLQDLGETFSITGAEALSAGLDIAQLTAVATTLAESTGKSSAEVGNSVRRMLTTIQSETGIEALRKVGIAVEDINGQMRDWDEIMEDIAARRRVGAISDAAFRQLTYALGGGPRGGPDIAAIIQSWDQITAKAEKFGNVNNRNAAMEAAMAAKSQTLTNALNELSTSFTELVQTLGTDGGLLDLAKSIVDILDVVVQNITSLTEVLGPATTRLIALGVAMSILSKYGPALGSWVSGKMGPQPTTGAQAGQGLWTSAGFMSGRQSQPTQATGGVGRTIGQLATPQMALAATYALSQLGTQGTMEEKGIRVGSTIAGAIIGALTPAGPIIGAAIGDAVGNALIGFMERNRIRTADVLSLNKDELAEAAKFATQELENRLSPAGLFARVFEPEKAGQRAEEFMKTYREEPRAAERLLRTTMAPAGRAIEFEENVQAAMDAAKAITDYEKQLVALGETTARQQEAVQALNDERAIEIKQLNDLSETLGTNRKIEESVWEAQRKWAAGDITKKVYTDLRDAAKEVQDVGPVAFEAFQNATQVGNEFIDDFMLRFIEMAPETRDDFMALVTQATELEDVLAKAMAGEDVANVEEYGRRLKSVQKEMQILYNQATALESAEPFRFLGFTDFEGTQREFEQILAAAKAEQENYREQLGITPEEMTGSISEWVAHFEGIYRAIDDVQQPFVNEQIQRWKDAQKELSNFSLQRLKDLKPEQIPELTKRVRGWEQYLKGVPGYQEQAEVQPFNLVIGEENVFHRLITTQEALRFAIEDLTEVEKKQLEGMWNIPAGATVMVPLQSLYYAPKGGAGGPGFPGGAPTGGEEVNRYGSLLSQGFEQPANKMDMAGDKMLEAASSMLQIGPTIYETTRRAETGGASMVDIGQTIYEATQAVKGTGSTMAEIGGVVAKTISQANINVDVPPINADITLTIPPITLDGQAVTRAISVRQSRTLRSAARARGSAGGGVIQ